MAGKSWPRCRRPRAAGFAHDFIKPVDLPELIAVLREHAHSLAAV
jgi:hypothetical protein